MDLHMRHIQDDGTLITPLSEPQILPNYILVFKPHFLTEQACIPAILNLLFHGFP
jgi:hypothetical protein